MCRSGQGRVRDVPIFQPDPFQLENMLAFYLPTCHFSKKFVQTRRFKAYWRVAICNPQEKKTISVIYRMKQWLTGIGDGNDARTVEVTVPDVSSSFLIVKVHGNGGMVHRQQRQETWPSISDHAAVHYAARIVYVRLELLN